MLTGMEVSSLRQNVDLITLDGKRIYLVGTAHISKASADLAEEIIREVRPDAVAVELCQARYESMRDPERWKKMDIISVIRQGKAYVLLTQLMLAAFQKKMGDELHVKPGLEMLRAFQTADEIGVTTLLIDRDIKTTLRRSWSLVGWWTMIKLFFSSLAASFDKKKLEEEEIELLKTGDALDALMKEFSDTLPEIRNTLIDERDKYMAAKLSQRSENVIVAILGAGHIPGIKTYLGQDIDVSRLEEIPPASFATKVIGWALPGLIVGMIIYGFLFSGAAASFQMVKAWAIITGTFAAVGSIISFGHPLTIIAAFFAAPITTIHPFLASGWVAGLVEAMVRRPQVSDFETITTDITSLKGIWRNRLARIFLIMIMTNTTTGIGMIWGMKVLATLV